MPLLKTNEGTPVAPPAPVAPKPAAPAPVAVAPPVAATVVAPIPAPAPVAVAPPAPVAQAMVPAAPAALAAPRAEVPSYIAMAAEGQVADGFENAGDVGMLCPMLCLAQPLTPEVMSGTLKPGDVYSHLDKSKNLFGVGATATFFPVFHFREWIEWQHRDLGGGMVARSKDPKGALAKRAAAELLGRKPGADKPTKEQAPTSVVESHVFLVLFRGEGGALEGPYAMALAKTKHKKARLLLALAQGRGARVPLWAGAYGMTPVVERNKQGQQYFNFDFKVAGFATEAEAKLLQAAYQQAADGYEAMQLQYADEPGDEPAAPADAAAKKSDTF